MQYSGVLNGKRKGHRCDDLAVKLIDITGMTNGGSVADCVAKV